MDLRRLIAILRTWAPLLVASVLLAAAAAFVVSSLQQKRYEAKATLIVGASLSAVNPDYNQLLVSQSLANTYASLATTRPILEAVIRQIGLPDSYDELTKRVQANADPSSTLLTVTVQDSDPARAAATANAVAQRLMAESPSLQGQQASLQGSIQAQLQATQDQISATQADVERLAAVASPTPQDLATLQGLQGDLITLRSTYASLVAASSSNASNLLSVVDPAVAPVTPVSPNRLLDTLLGGVLGLLFAMGFVFLFESIDDKVKDAEAVQDLLGLSTLGTITHVSGDRGQGTAHRLTGLLDPFSGSTEAYRTLRTNIEFSSVDTPIRTLLVTSADQGEGKTVTAANLAAVFAQAGRRVLLVDADLRRPSIHLMFDIPNAHGLTSLLRSDEVSIEEVAHKTEQENLRVLTTGPMPPNPAELLGSQRMHLIIDRLNVGSDLLIFDSPPLQAVADSAVLSSIADATLLVIDAQLSHRPAVREARELLDKAGANVLGVVLNRVPARAGASYSSYYSSYNGSSQSPRTRLPIVRATIVTVHRLWRGHRSGGQRQSLRRRHAVADDDD